MTTKTCRKTYMANYRAANREALVRQKAHYRESNREAIAMSKRAAWQSLTQAEQVAYNSVVKARRRSLLPVADLYGGLTFTQVVAITLPFAEERLRLEALTGIPHHIDHIISIKEGGTHTADNLQVLTASDNLAKG